MELIDINRNEVRLTEMPERVWEDGIIFLRGATAQSLVSSLGGWTEIFHHPHADQLGVTIISPRAQSSDLPGMKGFTNDALAPHTDRSTTSNPPAILATAVIEAASRGGRAMLCDGLAMLLTLRAEGLTIDDLSKIYLETEDGSRNGVFDFDGEKCRIRYRDDNVAHPQGTASGRVALACLRRFLPRGITIDMKEGDGYIVHNHRYLHGRQCFAGDRKIVRILANASGDSDAVAMNQGFIHPFGG
jgi:alpha-ketoglutarate-dependent taurine dioxygenase